MLPGIDNRARPLCKAQKKPRGLSAKTLRRDKKRSLGISITKMAGDNVGSERIERLAAFINTHATSYIFSNVNIYVNRVSRNENETFFHCKCDFYLR